MNKNRTYKALIAITSVLAMLSFSSVSASAAVETSQYVQSVSEADQNYVDAVSTKLKAYQSALGEYSAASSKKEANRTFKALSKAWKELVIVQKNAKKQIGKTFKAAVQNAKQSFDIAKRTATNTAQRAAAKATRDLAISNATQSRVDALALIGVEPPKPVKTSK
jgi:6-phosphogluconate dehydrogenase